MIAEDAAGNLSSASNEVSAAIADTTPPGAPGSLAATASGTSVSLTWTAATDNVGVVRYNVHRSTTSGFTPSAANRIAQPTGTSYTDTGLAAGTYFYKVTAEDAAGNVGAPSAQASATIPDTTPPTAPTGLNATGGAGQAALTWTAATDNVGVVRYNVHRSTTSGFTPSAANRIAQPTGTSYTDTGLAAGTYFYKVTAEDAAGNVGAPERPGERDRHRPGTDRPRRRVRFRRRQRHDDRRPVGQRQHGHALERDLVDGRQVRQRPLLQRHQRARERERLELSRHHERDDARGLGQADAREHGLPDDRHEGADR